MVTHEIRIDFINTTSVLRSTTKPLRKTGFDMTAYEEVKCRSSPRSRRWREWNIRISDDWRDLDWLRRCRLHTRSTAKLLQITGDRLPWHGRISGWATTGDIRINIVGTTLKSWSRAKLLQKTGFHRDTIWHIHEGSWVTFSEKLTTMQLGTGQLWRRRKLATRNFWKNFSTFS